MNIILSVAVLALFATAGALHSQQLLPPPSLVVTEAPPGTYVLSWFAENLRPYQLQTSLDLESWMPLGEPVLGTGSAKSVIVTSNAEKMFFRHREGATRRGLFNSDVLLGNDDGSTELVPLGFVIDLFGSENSEVYVNNNGNITFDAPLIAYTPLPLQRQDVALIAAFWADVDTRRLTSEVSPFPVIAREVTYGQGTVDGKAAFGINYFDVGYYQRRSEKLNTFQLVLIQRSDTGDSKNFDIEFNYDQIDWETGSASDSGGTLGLGGKSVRAGLTNGSNSTIEISGSGVNGVLLDENPTSHAKNLSTGLIYRSRNSVVPGRFVFQVRNSEVLGALVVDAGPDVSTANGPVYQLQGVASEPSGGTPTVLWNVLNGPADITFSAPTSLTSTMTNPSGANAVIQLTITSANDPTITAADVFRVQ